MLITCICIGFVLGIIFAYFLTKKIVQLIQTPENDDSDSWKPQGWKPDYEDE